MSLEAKELRALKTNLFATRDSVNDLFDELTATEYSKAEVIVFLMIHQNTLLEHLARSAEDVEED